MRKILPILLLPIALLSFGCAQQLQELKNVYSLVTSATVSPTAIIVAGNSFDALEGTGTQYLIYCKSFRTDPICAPGTVDNPGPLRQVLKYTRAGRAARNQLETYITTNTAAPSILYNTLITAINNLNTTPAANFTAPTGASK